MYLLLTVGMVKALPQHNMPILMLSLKKLLNTRQKEVSTYGNYVCRHKLEQGCAFLWMALE